MRRPRTVVSVYIKNLAKLTTDFILENKFEARRPKDRLEMAHSASSKLFFLRIATVCVVAIFFMATNIKVW